MTLAFPVRDLKVLDSGDSQLCPLHLFEFIEYRNMRCAVPGNKMGRYLHCTTNFYIEPRGTSYLPTQKATHSYNELGLSAHSPTRRMACVSFARSSTPKVVHVESCCQHRLAFSAPARRHAHGEIGL